MNFLNKACNLKFLIVFKFFEFCLSFSEFNYLSWPTKLFKCCRRYTKQNSRIKKKRCLTFLRALFLEIFFKFSLLSFLMHLSYLFSLSTFSDRLLSFKVFAWLSILKWVIYGLHVKSFKGFSNDRFYSCKAVSWAKLYCGALVFFVSSSDALFSFYICSHSKAEKVKFSEWLLPLTNGICARDVISHSL